MSQAENKALPRGIAVSLAISVLAGALAWTVWPWLYGNKEPWDASSGFYYGYLLGGGVLAGLASPRGFWAWP